MAVTQIDLIKRLNGSGTNSRKYAKSDGSGLWVPTDPLANPTFVDATTATKAVKFDLSNKSASTLTALWDDGGMSDDVVSYQEKTITTTGLLDDLDISNSISPAVSVLRLNNASLTQLGGFLNGKPGKLLGITAIGAGQVHLLNFSGGSSSNNYISTPTSSTIQLTTGGSALLRYQNFAWQVISWYQGLVVGYTPTWTCVGTAPSLGNGTITGNWYRMGQFVYFNIQLTWGSTSTSGTGGLLFSVPFGISGRNVGGTIICTDAGVTNYLANIIIQSSTTIGGVVSPNGRLTGTAPFTFGTNDTVEIDGYYIVA